MKGGGTRRNTDGVQEKKRNDRYDIFTEGGNRGKLRIGNERRMAIREWHGVSFILWT